MEIYLDMYQTITVAVLVLMLGKVLKKKFGILERFCIPAPVIGGVVFAAATRKAALPEQFLKGHCRKIRHERRLLRTYK